MKPRVVLFDLDNTLYPPECGLLQHLDARIDAFVSEYQGISLDETRALRKRYVQEYGTTLQGLQAEHGLTPAIYLSAVHDNVELEQFLTRDEALLAALTAIEIEKVVFTNAPGEYARRVMACLGLDEHFRHVIDLEFHNYHGKPFREAYERVIAHLDVIAEECLLVEDTYRNLRAAKELGMITVLVSTSGAAGEHADYVVQHPSEVAALLSTLGKSASGGGG
jgi:putative hydrolase of the HAD superfamily